MTPQLEIWGSIVLTPCPFEEFPEYYFPVVAWGEQNLERPAIRASRPSPDGSSLCCVLALLMEAIFCEA